MVPGYGELQPDPADVIDLPKGFFYKILGKAGEKTDVGLNLLGASDGMAAVKGAYG